MNNNNLTSSAATFATPPMPPDTRSARLARFALGSVFGVIFLTLFIYVFIVATRGPDELGKIAADGQPLGPLNDSGQVINQAGFHQRPKTGQLAPDFALASANGKYIHFKDLRGKVVLLNFWASWCAPCQEEAKDLQKAYIAHKDSDNFVILGVDHQETVDDVRSFFKTYSLSYPVVMDYDGKVGGYYGVTAQPESYFIDKNGIIHNVANIDPKNPDMAVITGAMTFDDVEQYIQSTVNAGGK